MKKILALGIIFCILSMTGCEVNVKKMFYPGTKEAELYYNTYKEVKNRIKREDVKRSTQYNDMFLSEEIEAGMDISEVLTSESREAVLDISTVSETFFLPKATGGTKLTDWINQSTIKYTFDKDQIVSSYQIINSKSNNTYLEYLYIMRALTLKYGECTTEIYKNEDNVINNEKIKEDYKETDKVIEFYESEFEKGNLEIISQWIENDYTIIVDFSSFNPCSVKYELADADSESVTEEE